MAQQSLVGRGLLIAEVSRLYSDAPHSLGLPWTSDQPVAETLPDNAQHSQETDIHASRALEQCFSTAGPRPGTGPWHQLYRAARGSPGICHLSFLGNFHE